MSHRVSVYLGAESHYLYAAGASDWKPTDECQSGDAVNLSLKLIGIHRHKRACVKGYVTLSVPERKVRVDSLDENFAKTKQTNKQNVCT